MLPGVDALFTLVRQLADRQPVTDVAAPKWLVQRHGLAAMAGRAGAASYRDDLVSATAFWSRIEADLPAVVAPLVDAGVRVAPIKGVAYAKALYSAPAERPMGDVDLLVREPDREIACNVLSKCGFAPAARRAVMHHAEPWTRGDFAIDLHWNIIAPGRSRIDLESIWSRMRSGWPAGAESLESNDLLVFHLVHLARNRLRLPLMNVIDAARILERADVATARERARVWGLGVATDLALRFCTSILESRPGRPAGWLGPSRDEVAQLAEEGLARKALFEVVMAGSARQLAARAVHFGANQLRRLSNR